MPRERAARLRWSRASEKPLRSQPPHADFAYPGQTAPAVADADGAGVAKIPLCAPHLEEYNEASSSSSTHVRIGPGINLVGRVQEGPAGCERSGQRTVGLAVDVVATPDGRLSSQYQWILTLDPVTSAKIMSYRPSGSRLEWPQVADQVRTLVAALAPMMGGRIDRTLTATARLAMWCYREGKPIDPEIWLQNETIHDFVLDSCSALGPDQGQAYRSCFRHMRAALALTGNGPRGLSAPRRFTTRPATPYDAREMAQLWCWAEHLSGQSREDALMLIALAYGCGLRQRELESVRGTHLRVLASGMVVLEVPCLDRITAARAPCQKFLADAARRVGHGRLYRPRRMAAHTMNSWRTSLPSCSLPALSPRRLRSTWVVELLSAGTDEALVAGTAGLSLEELADYRQFLPAGPHGTAPPPE